MRKNLTWTGLMILALALMFTIGCNKGDSSPTAPAISRPASSGTVTASDPAPEPVADATPDPCEEDASCGRSVSMEFEGTTLNISSTMHGPRQGEVCITDGFQGPLAGWYPWTVPGTGGASGPVTNSVPFTIEGTTWVNNFVSAEWPEGVCEKTFQPQFDAIRNTCTAPAAEWGKLLAVIFPQHAEAITITKEPGEWVWTKEVRINEEEWSECMSREDLPPDLDPTTIPEYDVGPNGPVLACVKYRKVTVARTASRSCSVDTQREERTFIEYERCECPVVCKEWYPGSLPYEGRGRITFMSKLPNGDYLWRIQNNTEFETIVANGPDLPFFVKPGTITAFTTEQPYYGVSISACDGTRIHGTASANETVENWCSYPSAEPGECASGLCFYEIKGAEEGTEGEVCEDRGGTWDRWGVSDKVQCAFDVPGLLDKMFRLTPGQSDPACLKYTGR